jgi:hypothetical protein
MSAIDDLEAVVGPDADMHTGHGRLWRTGHSQTMATAGHGQGHSHTMTMTKAIAI